MRFHYLLYFEAEENLSHNIFSPEEPLNSSLTKYFLNSSFYELQNKKIFDKLKEELVDIIEVIEFFKIELNLNFNNSKEFKFFVLHFTSAIELYHLIGDNYLPIGNEVDKLLDKLNLKLYKIQDIRHTRRFLVNIYIPPNLRNDIRDAMEGVIQNSETSELLIFNCSWQEYPFIFEFYHNFLYNFDEKFTNLIKKYVIEKLSIDHVNWDVHILDFSNRGIIMCPDKDINFEKVSYLLSEAFIQNLYGIYTRISDYFRLYQQKLLNLDEILPKLNYPEFLSNLKLLKINSFGEHPLLYLQDIDRILLKTSENSAERLDPPISEIFGNTPFGYNIYNKVMDDYISLKDELNSAITTLQIIISQKQADKKKIEEKLEVKEKDFIDAFRLALKNKGYIYLEPMNKGGDWAEIFYIYSKDDKDVRVAKVYKETLGRITEATYKSDTKKLMKIEHDNVVKIIDKGILEYNDKQFFFLILEHIRGKNFEEIDSRLFFELPYDERLKYLEQALDGINEFRANFDLHRDLHPGNIMITDENEKFIRKIKIIDPGSSRYFYEPDKEDIDLYSIRKGIFSLFLKQKEIKELEKNNELKSLKFPELRELIKKKILEQSSSDIDVINLDNFLNELFEERDEIDEEIGSIDPNRKHLIFFFASVPDNLKPNNFDFNDESSIKFIKNIHHDLRYTSPYGGMTDYGDILRDFTYQGDFYQADYLRNTDLIFNFARTKVYKNGVITITVAINASTIEDIKRSVRFLGIDDKILKTVWISNDLLSYLIVMWLKLTSTFYSELNFQGLLKLILSIYSGWDLSIVSSSNHRILAGNNINPHSEIDINIKNLRDKAKIFIILKSIFKEILRYFRVDIDEFEKGYGLFKDIVEGYFNTVFK